MRRFQGNEIVLMDQDSYYRDLGHLPLEDRRKINFDHPNSVDFDMLIHHMQELKKGNSVEKPVYDYVAHTRKPKAFLKIEPRKVLILEGILIFVFPELRELIDIKLYVDTDADVRVLRRILRDIHERGRGLQNVVDQYLGQVKLMHEEFVEPSKRWADLIIPEGAHNTTALDFVENRIKTLLTE